MIQHTLDAITEHTIHDLVTNKSPETKTLEYKEALPGATDSDKKETSADITAFANTQGGDLLYGITEERDEQGKPTGTPKEATGLPTTNPDQEVLRLTNLLRDTTQPRITGLHAKILTGFPQGPVILLRIPNSWNKPHMVTTNGRFYARTASGKYPMDRNELRDAFLATNTTTDRIKAFRDDRVRRIHENTIPTRISDGPKLILHLIPFQAMNPGTAINVTDLARHITDLRPMHPTSGWTPDYNLDGFLSRPNTTGPNPWYIQVFRNGSIEFVHTGYIDAAARNIFGSQIEREAIETVLRLWHIQQTLGIQPPVIISLTLTGVYGFTLEGARSTDRDILQLPEVLIEESTMDAPRALRPALDALWQAAGYEQSPYFEPNGSWRGRP